MVSERRKRLLPVLVLLTVIFTALSLCFNVSASVSKTSVSKSQVILADYDDCLTDAEETKLLEAMKKTAEKTGLNIGIVITAELDGKRSKKYADDFSDENFGVYSDSIVLLLLNTYDKPQYYYDQDQISTSGKAIYLFEKRINNIFDRIYKAFDNPNVKSDLPSKPNVYDGLSSAAYYVGCLNFCSGVERYADPASAFWLGILEFILSHILALFVGAVVGLIAALIFSSKTKKSYMKKSPISASQYIDKNRIDITRREDSFIREYTTSYRTSSSSSGGRSGGGGGRSGGGGSHGGGGGRHR